MASCPALASQFLLAALLLTLGAVMPYLARRNVVFGVRLPLALADDSRFQTLKRRYALVFALAGSACLATLCLLAADNPAAPLWQTAFVGVPLVLMAVMFFIFRAKARAVKATLAAANPIPACAVAVVGSPSKHMAISGWWHLLPLAVIAATVLVGLAFFDQMPQRIPLHWNMAGKPDRFADKSLSALMYAPLLQVLMALIMYGAHLVIARARLELDPEIPASSLEAQRRFRRQWSVFALVTSLMLCASFGLVQLQLVGMLPMNPMVMALVIMTGSLGLVVYALVLTVKLGQGGMRTVKATALDSRTRQDDDHLWRAGVFYYNPNDPSLWVEKRFGVGWTLNFARPAARVVMGVILLIALGVIGLSFWLAATGG